MSKVAEIRVSMREMMKKVSRKDENNVSTDSGNITSRRMQEG